MRLRVLHFGEKLFATVSAAKHGHDALNMCNEIRKIARREDEVAEEGQRRRGAELRLQSTEMRFGRMFYFFGWVFAGRIAMLLSSRVAGRTLGLRGPGLAPGPEVVRPCLRWSASAR